VKILQIIDFKSYLSHPEKDSRNKKNYDRGTVLAIVLVFVYLFIFIAGILLGLMINQARIVEHQIRRIRGFYSVWAGLVDNFERLRRNEGIQNTPDPNFQGRGVRTTTDSSSNQYNFRATYSP